MAGVVINLLEATGGKHLLISNVRFSSTLPVEEHPSRGKLEVSVNQNVRRAFCSQVPPSPLPSPAGQCLPLNLLGGLESSRVHFSHHSPAQKVQRKMHNV